jgi:hypothetical protein
MYYSYKNIILFILFLFYIYWRNHCSLIQIKNYYNQTELKKIIYYADNFCLKRNKNILHDLIIKLLPYQEIEIILNIHDCLLELSFVEYLSSSLITSNINNDDEKSIIVFRKDIITYEKMNFIQYLLVLTEHSDILQSIKKGKFTMNVVESLKIEIISKMNVLILKIKNIQNEIEYKIKQIIMESSFLFGLITNLFRFIIWSISIMTFFLISYKPISFFLL